MDVHNTAWAARWIWLEADEHSDIMLARKHFVLKAKLGEARCSITASSQYKLYVNEKFVTMGPARCAAHHQSFDVFDLSGVLGVGENVIAVEVHHQRENVSYEQESRGGLLFQLDIESPEDHLQIVSDDSWKVMPDPTWNHDSPRMSYAHMHVADRRDFRHEMGNWKSVDFDDHRWIQARVLRREKGWPLPQDDDRPGHLILPWVALEARNLPFLEYSRIAVRSFLQQGYLSECKNASNQDWLPVVEEILVDTKSLSHFELPARLSKVDKNSAPYIVFDLGDVHNAHTYLEIEGQAGTVIDILSVPFLLNDKLLSPLLGSHYVDRIVLSGNQDQWEALYWKPMRYVALIVRGEEEGDVEIHEIGVRKVEYPFELRASFSVPDFPDLERLYHASAKTIQTATTDAYTDNYRERRQYAQTAYYACLGNYHVFGDTALQRRYLIQIAQEQLANGLMPAYAPRHGDDYMVILDSNCFWLRGLCQYLIYSGDEETVLTLLPAAHKMIDFFHSFCNEDGLIDSPPYAYWLDHAMLDRRGANLCLNAHFLAGLEDFITVLRLLKQETSADVEVLNSWLVQMRRAIGRDFWDEKDGVFVDAVVDGEQSTMFSEHTQAMVLALEIASPEQQERMLAKLLVEDDSNFIRRESGMTIVTPAMSCFLHAGLCNAGELDASLDMLWRRFRHMLTPEHNGTLWEEWWLNGSGRRGKFNPIQGRSDAQTESAFPPWLFFRYVLGIEPVGVGMREIVLHYHDSDRLNERRGTMPTPQGELSVVWYVSKEAYQIELSIPEDTIVNVNRHSMPDAVLGQVTINGDICVGTELLGLEAGQYQIEIPREV